LPANGFRPQHDDSHDDDRTTRLIDLLLPETDGGAAIQLVVFLSLALAGIVLTRRRREWLVLSVGITLLGLGLFGVRAVH
jgi:hypothetical protein